MLPAARMSLCSSPWLLNTQWNSYAHGFFKCAMQKSHKGMEDVALEYGNVYMYIRNEYM